MDSPMDSPLVQTTLQAGTLSALSNILGQFITSYQANKPFTVDPTEFVRFVVFTIIITPPNFIWQSWLEAQFPGYTKRLSPAEKEQLVDRAVSGKSSAINGQDQAERRSGKGDVARDDGAKPGSDSKQLNIKNTAIKFALDQTLGATANTIMFLGGMALLQGRSPGYAVQEIQQQFWPLIFAGQKLWPAVSVVSFTLVPLEYRMMFGNIIGLFWGAYLSLISGAASSGAKTEL